MLLRVKRILLFWRDEDQKQLIDYFSWGLIPTNSKSDFAFKTINARVETVAEKPIYKNSFEFKRCIVPVSGFFEWKKASTYKIPYYIHPTKLPYFAFAGLYESFKDAEGNQVNSYSIITREASEKLKELHDRMPVVLKKKNYSKWLEKEAFFAFNQIANEHTNEFTIASFLCALKAKGETETEIHGFVNSVKNNAVKVKFSHENLIDTAGTGGDNGRTFNVSTCAAIVASGAGVCVAKHGNRAVSGKTGSADVLEELKVKIDSTPQLVEKQLKEIGISFLFAPIFHPSFKKVALVRKELGFKTVFNLLGPLSNPVGAKRQLVGVYDKTSALKVAKVLQLLGTKKSLVVSSDIDEFSLSNETQVFDVSKNKIKKSVLSPKDFGFKFCSLKKIQVSGAKESSKKILGVLNGNEGPCRDIVLLNAGAAIFVSGIAKSIQSGVSLAEKSIDSGRALEKLEALKGF